jgi:hypothetical protein
MLVLRAWTQNDLKGLILQKNSIGKRFENLENVDYEKTHSTENAEGSEGRQDSAPACIKIK